MIVKVGALSGLLILGGAVAVGASKNDTRVEDSIHQEDKNLDSHINGKKVKIETEHGRTVIKVKDDNGATVDLDEKLLSLSTMKTAMSK